MTFNNKVYDVLKWIATIVLPALATLYFSLASIWGLPYAEQVIGTITAVDTLLGILLGISTANYKGDGMLVIDLPKDEAMIDADFGALANKKTVTFTVATAGEAPDPDYEH